MIDSGYARLLLLAIHEVGSIYKIIAKKNRPTMLAYFSWQGYMDEDRTFYSVSENAISGGKNV